MKRLIFSLLLLSGVAGGADLIAPLYPDATITFSADGSDPVLNGIPVVGEDVGVIYNGTVPKTVSALKVTGDSLIVSTMPGVIYMKQAAPIIMYISTVQFMRMGVYKAFELDTSLDCAGGSCLVSLGVCRILPAPVTVPAVPVTSGPVSLQLVTGLTHTACPPTYERVSAQVKGTDVFFSFTEVPFAGGCVGIYIDPPEPYGPSVDLGRLAAGTYTVYIEDSVTVGSFAVEDPRPVSGSVVKMKHPYIKMPDQPLAGTKIVAEVYQPCTWYLDYTVEGVVCSTVSDSDGRFALNLPRKNLDYELTATLKGYHLQKLYIPAADSALTALSYKLIPDTDDSVVDVSVAVTDGGVPVESVYVSLEAGPGLAICPMLAAKKSAVTAGAYTDAAGECVLKGVSVLPYIDYRWSAAKYGSVSLRADGELRLYQASGWENVLAVDFRTSGIDDRAGTAVSPRFVLQPNPAVHTVEIRLSGGTAGGISVAVFDAAGRQVAASTGLRLDTRSWQEGVYLVRITADGRQYDKKLFVNKP